jgi:glucose/arabinose dehydrogenase
LGLAFVPSSSNWPDEYKNNLIVAFHGSWNRNVPTGYKLVRIKLDSAGNQPDGVSGSDDFITGWINGGSVLGRPVDVLIEPSGAMLISDDKAGVIYAVTYGR